MHISSTDVLNMITSHMFYPSQQYCVSMLQHGDICLINVYIMIEMHKGILHPTCIYLQNYLIVRANNLIF